MNNIWQGEFGDEYTRRYQGSVSARAMAWVRLIPHGTRSVLEVGANKGLNLQAISALGIDELYAAEPNELALGLLMESGILPKDNIRADFAHQLGFPDGFVDCALTSGVLIHISPDYLLASMREIHRCSRKWIICGEYFAKQERMIPYRGTKDTLWVRNYRDLWLENFPDLKLVQSWFADKVLTGLDDVNYWVFEKHGTSRS